MRTSHDFLSSPRSSRRRVSCGDVVRRAVARRSSSSTRSTASAARRRPGTPSPRCSRTSSRTSPRRRPARRPRRARRSSTTRAGDHAHRPEGHRHGGDAVGADSHNEITITRYRVEYRPRGRPQHAGRRRPVSGSTARSPARSGQRHATFGFELVRTSPSGVAARAAANSPRSSRHRQRDLLRPRPGPATKSPPPARFRSISATLGILSHEGSCQAAARRRCRLVASAGCTVHQTEAPRA